MDTRSYEDTFGEHSFQRAPPVSTSHPVSAYHETEWTTRSPHRNVMNVNDVLANLIQKFRRVAAITSPGTGTPVPGGLTTYETQRILRALNIKNLVGADIVEVCPAYDHGDITALAAVDTAFEILHLF